MFSVYLFPNAKSPKQNKLIFAEKKRDKSFKVAF
jgi:hypothetical protein